VPRARTAAACAALAALAVSGCSGDASENGSAVSEGDPDACPGEVVDVVVSVGQWGDLVRQLGGDCATVTTIVSSGAVDPHDFEPGTAALAAFSDADLVVYNGANYDHWAEDAAATLDPEPAVVSAADVAGVADAGADPHLWYSPEVVQEMSTAVSEALAELSGDDATDYLAERAAAWAEARAPYDDAVRNVAALASGRTYAATEPVFDRMAEAVGLTDATPEGYRRASSNDSDPAPGDLTAFEAALADGSVDVLVFNTQTSGSVPDQLRAAAERAGVPVVEVSESPADADGSFVAWQVAQLTELSDALGRTP
jgi:zinc/manganese transport system substrate-binding protein